uniref:Craniofacial development protein 2-like n=1 Tax=Plectus sambesii TaxID=2011161 RepID=A0A914VBS7_9BILA
MASDQSPTAVQNLMPRPPFNTKEITLIGTWNVQTLFQTGKTAQLLQEFDTYQLDVMGISEMRWTGSGRFVSNGKVIIYSGNNTEHVRGVGIILSK